MLMVVAQFPLPHMVNLLARTELKYSNNKTQKTVTARTILRVIAFTEVNGKTSLNFK